MKNGPYELVLAPVGYPGKRYRGRYVYEHILVWWQQTGSLPPPGHVVHHKNEQKRDNRFENLELKDANRHSRDHAAERIAPLEPVECAGCGKTFEGRPRDLRRRRKASKDGGVRCSRSCGRRAGWPRKRQPIVHGTRSGYLKKCRCEACRLANARYTAELRRRRGV